ncbi:hypothetical protein BVRB_4g071780 [Beta vulgaris subsp. vulgaris]|nr:hypothetical protein BVRB_4g071780 [Beta vulgaris subsp. vulgaris]
MASVKRMSKVHSSKYQKLMLLQENAGDILEKQKAHELTVSIVNTSKPKVSTYPEKLLPFNKRKSRYYVCQEDKNVMSTNEENSSSRSDFAFGFHQFLKNNHLFLLAIWYAKIPDTIVWYANEGNPVPQGSTVTLTANQGLILSDHQGSQLWNSSVVLSGADVISHGFMNDTGNLILESSSNNSIVWQSFEHPTDTLLPTQTMETDGTVNSRLSETNFTKGRFQMHLQTDGNWVLNVMDPTIYKADIIPYFALDTWKPPNQGKQVIYTESGNMYLVAANGTVVYNCIPQDKIVPIKDYYQRATLNFDGVLTCYDDEDQSVRCSCPANYSLIDPNEKYGSCKPDFELWEENGQGANVEHNLVPIGNTKFEKCDGTFHDISVEECKTSCLNDNFCAVATWDTEYGGTCCKKKPLFIGADQSSGVGKIAWLKVGNGTYSTTPSAVLPEAKAKINTVVSVLLGGSVFVNITLLILAMFFICNKKQIRSVEKPCEEYGNVHYFSYEVLEKATNGFKEELGRGAFGIVYKGVIEARTSPMVVAVKKLERMSHHADKEFETEVNVIAKAELGSKDSNCSSYSERSPVFTRGVQHPDHSL